MANFNNLKKLEIRNEAVDYPMYQIDEDVVLKLLPALEINKPYYNDLFRNSRGRVKAIQSSKLNVGMLKDNRNEDRVLYSKHVVKGWTGVVDDDGKEVPFTEKDALGFLTALPDYIFEDIRNFATEIQNYIEDIINTEDIAKN